MDCDEELERHSDYFLICTAYEAIRIGALVHDIGHMPLSHIFESAVFSTHWDSIAEKNNFRKVSDAIQEEINVRVEEYKKSLTRDSQKEQVEKIYGNTDDFEFHELRGLFVFKRICEGIIGKHDIYDSLITELTQEILLSLVATECQGKSLDIEQDAPYNLFGFFHSFFANDFVDSDRLDYTLRDPLSSGVKYSDINLDLLYENVFFRKKTNSGNSNIFYLAWNSKAVPSIEVFFHQRYLGYKFIAFNHSVMRTNAVAE